MRFAEVNEGKVGEWRRKDGVVGRARGWVGSWFRPKTHGGGGGRRSEQEVMTERTRLLG